MQQTQSETRLKAELLAFLKDNLHIIDMLSDGRGHATLNLEVRDGVLAECSINLKARRQNGRDMGVLPKEEL